MREVRWALLVALAVAGVRLRATLSAYGRALLLVAESFPQIPLKPLTSLTSAPRHEHCTFAAPGGTVVADLFLPTGGPGPRSPGRRSTPAIILAMGIRTQEKDRPILFQLGATLSRLGFVVIWPRLEALDRGVFLPEEPSTFVATVRYLDRLELVDPRRISMVGFSVGSSVAFVAATDHDIADRVRAVVFFGGYYDVFAYLTTMVTQQMTCGGRTQRWQADPGAIANVTGLLQEQHAAALLRVLDARTESDVEEALRRAPPAEIDQLRRINPRDHLEGIKARIFILHDTGDHYVPYCEGVRLHEALAARGDTRFLLVDVFEHVQPSGSVTPRTIAHLVRLYAFLASALEYL